MIEKAKTLLLVMLVALSLIQSYFLAYSMPGLGATVKTGQDLSNADPLGKKSSVESVVFPEEIVLHFGGNEHTVLYPGTTFYNMILKDRIQGREFKGFQRNPANLLNWDEVRKNDIGVELRFQNGIPVELLKKLLKVQGDLLFLGETIDRIWIFKATDSEEVRTFFFSADGQKVYESTQADLTVRDVQDYVGFGEYQPKYQMTSDGIYLPKQPIQSVEMVFPYETYSSELMQQNLFFDTATTKALYDRSGSQIFTDGKRGLQIEQKGKWMIYTNPAASQSEENPLSENVFASIEFINDHGGWDGVHRFVNPGINLEGKTGKYAEFQQYVDNYPVIESKDFEYGSMRLTLQQGVVTEYSRSLITLATRSKTREARWLPGGAQLRSALDHYNRRSEVVRLFPALKAEPLENNELKFIPVWAVQLEDGTQEALTEAYPTGFVPQEIKDSLSSAHDSGEGTGTDKGGREASGQETASKDGNDLFGGSDPLQNSIAPDKESKQ
ncbi:two-component system activity regulator YycH [Paenibacillus sp. BK720]|uniref:YycH family regulatory protein n=1 Tax=Paenibacillus sp. BK720 TaxID=2587092 RepID=UPI00142151BF|nr:two-component system activity regulator YycH [Paenibacillus sp. BK720]NIK71444.1 regulatory protein YycH of two-component signal transduction system YycFG [Paenibacillus sp. BK720]